MAVYEISGNALLDGHSLAKDRTACHLIAAKTI
jgi:hypothetical protein